MRRIQGGRQAAPTRPARGFRACRPRNFCPRKEKENENDKVKAKEEEELPTKPIADLDEFKPDMSEQLTQDGSTLPDVKESSMKTLFPGRRGVLLPAAHATRLSGDRSRRGRDRPGGHPRQLHGDRLAARHHHQDTLGRCPPVRRAAPGHQEVRHRSSATPSTTSRSRGTSRRASSTRSSRKCSRPAAST